MSNDHLDYSRLRKIVDVAALPIMYEQSIKSGHAHEEALKILNENAGENVTINVVRVEHSTAVVLQDKATGSIKVALDASDEWQDKMRDAQFWMKNNGFGVGQPTGEVHSGFLSALNVMDHSSSSPSLPFHVQVSEQVERLASEWKSQHGESVDVELAGFSKGGAESLILGEEWLKNPIKNVRIVGITTFGSPPSGDANFVRSLEEKSKTQGVELLRVVMNNDPIPDLLSSFKGLPLFPDYEHINPVLLLDANEKSAVLHPKVKEKIYDNKSGGDGHDINKYATTISDVKLSRDIGKINECLSAYNVSTLVDCDSFGTTSPVNLPAGVTSDLVAKRF